MLYTLNKHWYVYGGRCNKVIKGKSRWQVWLWHYRKQKQKYSLLCNVLPLFESQNNILCANSLLWSFTSLEIFTVVPLYSYIIYLGRDKKKFISWEWYMGFDLWLHLLTGLNFMTLQTKGNQLMVKYRTIFDYNSKQQKISRSQLLHAAWNETDGNNETESKQ